ncbi:MAG: glycosyltransferase family 4 protein [Candidatus Babeliales bacterium]|jgi:glycosyltransferase involved in cell wall biosynthesis
MRTPIKPKIAILSLRNTYNYGGVLACLKSAYQFCEHYFEPRVFFLGFEPEVATKLRAFKFTSAVKPLSHFGMNSVEIGTRWSFWEPGHYIFTQQSWQELLKDYDYFFVVSGTSIAAHSLLATNKKFVLWISTPYDEDRQERVKQLRGIRALINAAAHPWMNRIERKILTKANFILALSTYAKSKFEYIIKHPRENMVVCSYPIDGSRITPQYVKSGEKIIMAVGRFSDPRKNLPMLLRVFERIYRHIPTIKLYIVGMKPSPEIMASFQRYDSLRNTIFTGQIATEDLYALYRRASLLLITSYQEGLGIVGLEALLHGTPVVATDCGGTSDYVINNITGYLVPINDDNEMVANVEKILTDPILQETLSRNGREFVEKNFSPNKSFTLFKYGLSTVYPELKSWFEKCDHQHRGTTPHKPRSTLYQDAI